MRAKQNTTIKEKLQRSALVGRKVVINYPKERELYKLLVPKPKNKLSQELIWNQVKAMVNELKRDGFKGHIVAIAKEEIKDFDLVKV